MGRWAFEGLNRLQDSLDQTAVISKDYRNFILSWAQHAVGEAAEAARRKEQVRWVAQGQEWREREGQKRTVAILKVERVRRLSPAWDAGHRDRVKVTTGSIASEGSFYVTLEDLEKDWHRVA